MAANVLVSASSLVSVNFKRFILFLLVALTLVGAFTSAAVASKSKNVFTKTDTLPLVETIRIKVREANLYAAASLNSAIVRVAGFGAVFEVIDTIQDFYLVKDPITGSFLFVKFADAGIESSPKLEAMHKDYIRSLKWNLNSSGWWYANDFVKNRRARNSGRDSAWAGCQPYDFSRVSENYNYQTKSNGYKAIKKAFEYEGTPYYWGGSSYSGIDCSGLVQEVFKEQGIYLPHKAHQQALQGKLVKKHELQPGDVIFFKSPRKPGYISHTGIYIGNGEFIHATSKQNKVTKSKLTDKYYSANFAFARRY